MPKIALDPMAPEALPLPARGQVDYWDGGTSGLGLRVSQGGTKSWVAMIERDGRKRRVTFGTYPALTLEGARRMLGALNARPGMLADQLARPRRPRGRPPKRALIPPAPPAPAGALEPSPLGLDFAATLERLPCAILVLERDRIRRANGVAIALLGAIDADQLEGRALESVIHPADRARFAVQLSGKDLERRAKPRSLRLRLLRLDGSAFSAEVAGVAIAGPDGADRLISLLDRSEDETAIDSLRHAAERAEATNEAKSGFLATLSHELRTPLAAMIGILRLLEESELDPTQRHHVAVAIHAADGLLEVLHDASDLARIEAGKLELRRAPFDLHAAAEAAVALFAAGAEDKRVALKLDIASDVPRLVEGDSGRLRQVLVNLVSNALKFTDAGSIDVEVSALGIEEGRRLVRFEVRDTGIGIPADKRARLFTTHGRLDRPASKPRPGAGLGLSISQALVGLMGGTIGFESEYGKGSRFHFTVAFAPAEGRAESPPAPLAPIPVAPIAPLPALLGPMPASGLGPVEAAGPRKPRILLCDDDATLREVLIAMLRDRPVEVEPAARGDEAVERVRDGDFDLALMDVTMPGLDGIEATRLIRALPGKAGRIPILALTGLVGDEDRRRGLEAGMNDYLEKPVTRQALDAALGRYLSIEAPKSREDAMSQGQPEGPHEPAPSGDGLRPALDRATLEQLVHDIGAETLRTLILGMIDETDARIGRMAEKYAASDWPELTREAHSLKGASRSYGAPDLAELAQAIERAAGERRSADLVKLMAALPGLTRATLAAYKALLGV